jgi:transposase
MDSPVCLREIRALVFIGVGIRSSTKRKESDMNATSVAVDLAKSVFQLAVADERWRTVETQRLTRTRFERWFVNRPVGLVVMEDCGSARHFASWFGLTPREHSSGSSRCLGKISKRGDRYLRMLLTHGAKSVLRAAKVAEAAERETRRSPERPL